MIIIPTSELIGGITDVLPQIIDPKHSATAGVVLSWGGEYLRFAAFDTNSGAEVLWDPETVEALEGEQGEDPNWGAEEEIPWRVYITYDDAKEIVKLFKLPAKDWRFPVRVKVNQLGTRLTIERDDMPRGQRLLVVTTYNDMLKHIPNILHVATMQNPEPRKNSPALPGHRLAAFGAARYHGEMTLIWGADTEPVQVRVGNRMAGFVFPVGQGYSALKHGAGVVTGRAGSAAHDGAEDDGPA